MKTKSKIRKGKATGKPGGGPKDVDAYIRRAPEPARAMLTKMRAAIRSASPKASAETISYRIPAIRHGKVLVWFASFTGHCSLFPSAAVIEQFHDELKGFSKSKGTIHFPLDQPLPTALIKKLVKARMAQNSQK